MPIADATKALIKRPKMRVFRNLLIRRRVAATGNFETSWYTIPSKYLKKWGEIERGVSNVKANFYKYTGLSVELNNEDGIFNDVGDDSSLFYGYLSVYRTLVKVEAGYLDDSDNQYPTDPSVYLGYIGEGIIRDDKGIFKLQTHHVSKIFDEFPASRIAGLGSAQTASEIIAKIRDHTDDFGIAIFQNYISSSAWTIETTTDDYDIATSTTLQNKSVWKLMQLLAEAENKLLYIDPVGNFIFQAASAASTSTWHFSGSQDEDQTYGHNILSILQLDEKIQNVYNRVRIKHAPGDTLTSYHVKNEDWNWGDSSSSFKWGIRTYEYKNEFLNSTTAVTVADTIYNKYVQPKLEARFKSKFLPGLDISDTVDVTHVTGSILGGAYGKGDFGDGIYGSYTPGSVNLVNASFLVDQIKHNLEDFTTEVTLQDAS